LSLNDANSLAAAGRLLQAEDLYWQEIEAGNSEARLYLAYAFHDSGLHSLAMDHYLELEGTNYWSSAAPQLADLYLEIHHYKESRAVLAGLSPEIVAGSLEAIESVEQKTASYISEVPEIVENLLLNESQLLEHLRNNPDLKDQIQLVEIRGFLAHYATVLQSSLGSSVAMQSSELNVGGLSVSRDVRAALGSASRRWFEAAHATVNAFTLLNQLNPGDTSNFRELALSAMGQLEKKFLISGRELTEEGEDFVVHNLIWALNSIQAPAKDFYSHLLPD